MQYSPASRNQSDNGTLAGLLRLVLGKHLQGVDDMLPAKVIAYSAAKNRAQVQPLIHVVTTGNTLVERAQVASVPVAQFGAGGFVIRFPVRTGDTGWIKANDRDISLFKQSYQASSPNTQRKHSFEDALFIPDTLLNGITIAPEDAANAVLQNAAGTVRLALWPGQMKVTTPNMGIGDTAGYTPNAHAILDVQSTTRAFIPPRMTQAQRDAIPSPVEGMTIYNLDTHGLNTYTDTGWP